MVVGESVDKNEDNTSKPFVGRAGALLRDMLEDYGFHRENIFITNAVSCQVAFGKSPTKTEIKNCKKWLDYQISMVKPKYVLLLGNAALQSVTGKAGISKMHGRPFEQDGIIYLPTFAPAFALRDPKNESVIRHDISVLRDIVDFGGIPKSKELDFTVVKTLDDIERMLRDLVKCGVVSFDIEATGLYPWANEKVTMLGFGTARHQWCIPMETFNVWSLQNQIEIVQRIDDIADQLTLIMHNGKFDAGFMRVKYGVRWDVAFDTMIAHYLIDENDRHGLKYLAMKYLNAPDWEIDLDAKQGNTSVDKLALYQAHDVYYTRKLRYVFGRLLNKDKGIKQVFDHILMPAVGLFTEIEYDGVYINVEQFEEAEIAIQELLDQALRDLKEWEPAHTYNAKGKEVEFNWGSPKQLCELLYDQMGIKCPEFTKTGNPSVGESALNQIDHPCVGALKRYRSAKQQMSFFIEGWKPFLVEHSDGFYLHPSFKLHGTVTGRPSCEHPNFQQVPRDPRIRSLISAPPGWELIEVDLSQIELRIVAELSMDEAMLHAFKNGIDIHWLTVLREIEEAHAYEELVMSTAQRLSNEEFDYHGAIDILVNAGPDRAIEVNSEWKELRKKAKAINFGYVYGMWWKRFKMYARDNYGVEVTDGEAQHSRETFFKNYPGLTPYHKRQKRHANEMGFVRSLSGRMRRLPDAQQAGNSGQKQQAERQAVNSPVQSFASDLNLMAALQLRKEFGRKIVRICATVHDAILLRVRIDMVEKVYNRLLEIMRWPELLDVLKIELEVPLEADGAIGPWSKGVSLKEWKDAQSKSIKGENVSHVSLSVPPKVRRKVAQKGPRKTSRVRKSRA